jgi:predicted nucleic acid-binding protein
MILVDTNILLRSLQEDHPQSPIAKRAIEKLMGQGHDLALVLQVIAEFWNVCTRPADKNGLGLTTARTAVKLQQLESVMIFYRDVPAIYDIWRDLVSRYDVKGAKVHDTKLVAAMLAHELTHILTFNGDDFKRFQEIDIIHPEKEG